MQITSNTTPFPADLFVFTDKHGQKHVVVVLKASYAVDGEGACRPAEEQTPLVYTDEHYGDPAKTALRFENDFAPVKPRPEVLLHAEAVAPGGAPAASVGVALAGPGLQKTALVTGDRIWTDGLTGVKASKPEPFLTLPLSWDRAFGGSDQTFARVAKHGHELRNPVGRGFHLNGDKQTIVGLALPNIERTDGLMRDWSDRPDPIGFGPIGRSWQPRVGFAGTYDQRWMDEDLPFLPPDFDGRYFQSAPLDQQMAALEPGAVFQCLNMNPSGHFTATLPMLKVPVRFVFDDRKATATLVPDTLILQPGGGRILLTGRVRIPMPRKVTALREIQVGVQKHVVGPGKVHYRNLAEAAAVLRRRRRPS